MSTSSPYLNRFVQPDTIIPYPLNPQSFNRYSYVLGHPIKYADPSGHGVDCGIGTGCVKDYSSAKTLEDFEEMSWTERKRWVSEFASERGLEDWFGDMESAIDTMASDPIYKEEGGTAEVMDAAVLKAINDGWNMVHNNGEATDGGAGWANFFINLEANANANVNGPTINVLRLQAEQTGVDYAWSSDHVQDAYTNSNILEQAYFASLLDSANLYRSVGIYGVPGYLEPGSIDPRKTGQAVSFLSNFLPIGALGELYFYEQRIYPPLFPPPLYITPLTYP